ncbi:hypothetical protein QTG54_005239 [Skeletonema marinoi]|uniref:Uncharacterized protein n=1 Tax=Skeletonema marinoi TaxID=267567 RepID=A0AAD8YCI5_9STRA|nr:hypothetical protein QTG54_005239 [Skeletonema marinoi]
MRVLLFALSASSVAAFAPSAVVRRTLNQSTSLNVDLEYGLKNGYVPASAGDGGQGEFGAQSPNDWRYPEPPPSVKPHTVVPLMVEKSLGSLRPSPLSVLTWRRQMRLLRLSPRMLPHSRLRNSAPPAHTNSPPLRPPLKNLLASLDTQNSLR